MAQFTRPDRWSGGDFARRGNLYVPRYADRRIVPGRSWKEYRSQFQAVIAFVQDDSTGGNNASTTVADSYGSNNTAGNLLVLSVSWTHGSATASIADTQTNAWAQCFARQSAGGGGDHLQQFYAWNCAGGANTVTATFTSSSTFRRLIINEYSGVENASDPLDVVSSATAISANGVSGAATTTQANNLIFGSITLFGNITTTAGSGYTLRIQQQNQDTSSEDILDAGAAGSEEVAFVHSSVEHMCGMSTFFIAAAAGANPKGPLGMPLHGPLGGPIGA